MFHRVSTEEWHQIAPILSFVLTFAVFTTALLRALLSGKEKCQHLATLPLDEQSNPSPKANIHES